MSSSKIPADGLKRTSVSLALVHWPIYDRAKNTICTNVTNFDVHDIARAARSYGLQDYHIVNRIPEQLMFVSRMLEHWRLGEGAKYNPMRRTALGMVKTARFLEEVIASYPTPPLVVATTARKIPELTTFSFRSLREEIAENRQNRPLLLVFGTGFGLHDDVFKMCHGTLEPIMGAAPDEYRHLSVRSAVSICLDRLLGAW